MKTHTRIILLISFALAIAACASNSNQENIAASESGQDKSELAALMRVMEAHGDEVRMALKTGDPLPTRPEGIDDIFEAQPTPKMHIDEPTFPVFAEQYLKSIDQLYAASPEDLKEVYNGLVQSCKNCHTVNCPGPLMKIDKMYLGEH